MKVIKTDKHYMAESDFEIDHYKDTNYHQVASHYHEFYEIFLFVSGHTDYVVHDKMFRLQPGDLLIIPLPPCIIRSSAILKYPMNAMFSG